MFDTNSLMKWLEKQLQETVKNHDWQINCPECDSDLWWHSLKELNKNNVLHCSKCDKDVVINLDKVDRKYK